MEATLTDAWPGDTAALTLAISSKQSVLMQALSEFNYTRQSFIRLQLIGLPKAASVCLYAWPEPVGRPTRIGVDVVQVDSMVLPETLHLSLPVPTEEVLPLPPLSMTAAEVDFEEARPDTLRHLGAEWRLVRPQITREIIDLDDAGQPVYAEVDTAKKCYQLVCPRCSRVRYAQRNSTHQIKYCWVCTKQQRTRKRCLSQYAARQRQGYRRRHSPEVRAEILKLGQEGARTAEISRNTGVAPCSVHRILKQAGLR